MPLHIMVLYAVISFIIALFGMNRKFGFWGYFFASLLFTPFVGAILVFASSPRDDKDGDSK